MTLWSAAGTLPGTTPLARLRRGRTRWRRLFGNQRRCARLGRSLDAPTAGPAGQHRVVARPVPARAAATSATGLYGQTVNACPTTAREPLAAPTAGVSADQRVGGLRSRRSLEDLPPHRGQVLDHPQPRRSGVPAQRIVLTRRRLRSPERAQRVHRPSLDRPP